MYLVYILHSKKSEKFYVGQSKDLQRRLLQHNNSYSKSTRSGIPWELVYTEEFDTRSTAMKREKQIKSMKSKDYIIRLLKK